MWLRVFTISLEVSSKIRDELAKFRAAKLALLKEAAVPSGDRALMPPSVKKTGFELV